jgi:lysozyme
MDDMGMRTHSSRAVWVAIAPMVLVLGCGAQIKSVGLVRGAYQYFEPGQDALAQADMVVQKVGLLGPGDLPVQLDMEATGGQSSATIVSKAKAWSDRVTAGTGKRPMVYTARYFWNDNVGSTDFASYPLWVANYGVSCPNTPDAWSKMGSSGNTAITGPSPA